MNRKTLVVAAAAGALVVSAGTAFALATNDSPTPAAVQFQPTTSSTSTSSTSSSSSTEDSPTSSSPTSSSSSSSATPAPGGTKLSPDDAVAIVKTRLGGGQVHEVERELEHGRVEWKVEISKDGTTYDIRVDAENGNITRVDTDDDRGRGGDDRDDSGHGGDDDRGGDDNSGHGGDDDRGGDDNSGHGDDEGGDR